MLFFFRVEDAYCFLYNCGSQRENRLVAEKLIPTGKPIPLAMAAIEKPPVMVVVVIRLVSRTAVVVLKRFIFFASFSRVSISSKKYASISLIMQGDRFESLLLAMVEHLDLR